MTELSSQTVAAVARDDGIPLYLKVASVLREKIRRGELPKGDKLAPIPELQAEYGVARSTIRQALAVLQSEGMISSARGRGTVVTGAQDLALSNVPVYDSLQLPAGISYEVLGRTRCERIPDIGIEIEDMSGPFMRIRKRNHYGGNPYSLVDVWLPQRLYELCPPEEDRRKLYSRLLVEFANVKSLHGYQKITIVRASHEVANLLGVQLSTPLARISSRLWDECGATVMAHTTLIRSDMFVVERNFGDIVTGDPATWRPKMPSATRAHSFQKNRGDEP